MPQISPISWLAIPVLILLSIYTISSLNTHNLNSNYTTLNNSNKLINW